MDITRIRPLRGPNLWSKHTAIEAVVVCTDAEQKLPPNNGFEKKLRRIFPQVPNLSPSTATAPLSLAVALEKVALGLQAQAGCTVSFSRCSPTQEFGVYQVIVEYTEEAVGKLAFELAHQLCQAAFEGQHYDFPGAVARLAALDEDVRLGPSTGSIVEAAVKRGIPFRRLTEGSLIQFGWGSKQRRIQAAEADGTSAIAESIAQDKDLTKSLLMAAGVPVPVGSPAQSLEQAWLLAQSIGLPVVVKPQDGNQGKGVTVNISTREQFEHAYASANDHGTVLVEKYLPGADYRMLVVGNKLVAAARREPPLVIGDGKHTVRQLVDKVNEDPRRGDGHATALTKIRFDDIAVGRLAEQGFLPDSIPEKGKRVILRNNANLSTGGSATDVTDDVHPELAARVIDAAQMVGVEICGVDVVCESVLKPLEEQHGGVVEVNAAPGLRMHITPSYGKGRDVGQAVIEHMFGPSDNGRIPVIAVTGTNGKTTTTRLAAHLLKASGLRVGMTNTDGVYVNDRQIDSGDCSGPRSARNVLMHPEVDAAVFETARGGILREGLGFDQCQVAVVTNLGQGDHLGMNYINTIDELAVLKRVIVLNVPKNGMAVLNAADPAVAAMAAHCQGAVTFFAQDKHTPKLAAHRAQGKRVVYQDGADLVAQEGAWTHRIPFKNIPITRNGSIGFQVENVLASVAAAWAVGIAWSAIEQGLAGFISSVQGVPGRFNVFEHKGATVIADYGHNPDAMQALVQAVDNMPAKKRIALISAAGDRRDEDIRDQTRILGAAFDEVLLFQDACQRGRGEGEVMQLLREGLQGASRTQYVQEIHGEFTAIDTALSRLDPDDLCLILVDQVQEALDHIGQKARAVA
jgi:cyanophycin synthetase